MMPKEFGATHPENILIQMEKSFESLCASLEDAGVNAPKSLTTFEFYSRVEYYDQKAREQQRKIEKG